MKKLIKAFMRLLAVCLVLGILAVAYAFLVEPRLLLVRSYDLGKKENTGDLLTVVQISDIHIGPYYKEDRLAKLTGKVNGEAPDILLFTGDLFDNFSKYRPKDEVIEELKRMEAAYGKYAVWGNRDYGGGAYRDYREIMEESGFTLLVNESVTIALPGGKSVFLGGVDDFLLGEPDFEETIRKREKENFAIIAMHEPDRAEELSGKGIDLVLSGHSHGGQVRIPFMKLITTRLAEKYTNGFYYPEGGPLVFVNTGIGTTRIPARFMVPPKVCVFRIRL